MRAFISAKYDCIFGSRKLMNLIVIENNRSNVTKSADMLRQQIDEQKSSKFCYFVRI